MPSTSVIRSTGLLRSPKSILRCSSRPSPLPLSPSPFPFSTTFNLLLSASARSPHVHFPPSPALFATFATHCPSSYDRGPYPVSPSTQQDALTVTSPSLSGFRLSAPPKRKQARTPEVFQHQDPRSPRPAVMQSFAAAMSIGSKPRTELKKALTSYPLSPYPSTPVSPVADLDLGAKPMEADDAVKTRSRASSAPSRQSKKRSRTADGVRTVPRTTGEKTKEKPQSIAFQLTSSRRLAPPHLDLTATKINPYLTPVQETRDAIAATDSTTVNPTEDDIDALSDESSGESMRLSNAFWQSVSIEVEEASPSQSNGIGFGFPSSGSASSDGGFPESVTGSQASDLLFSPRPGRAMTFPRARMPPPRLERLPTLTFGKSDGTIWSPGANSSSFSSSISAEDDALLAGSNTLMVPRNVFTAPTPNDPFAKFPSFAAVLEAGTTTAKTATLGSILSPSVVDSVQLPPRVHLC